jgi:Fe-S-cluster-containing hydrogenase component 2
MATRENNMMTGKKKAGSTDRRQFLTGAGTVLAFGTVARFTSSTSLAQTKSDMKPIAARIEHNASSCAGCGVCGLMCSLYHEKETALLLSRSEIVREPFEAYYSLNVCRQCLSPSCYLSCPLKDSALCIDEMTGVKYINEDNCDGCGECTEACPMAPARVKLNMDKKVAFKCDLCRGREKGPICVEYCSQQALSIVPEKMRV